MEKNSLSFCCKLIEDFSVEYNLNIKVSTENDEIILPFAVGAERIVYLSKKCYALIMLNVLGEVQSYIELLLAIHMAQNDKYDYLDELLDNYSLNFKINNKSQIQKSVFVQMFVISMHELAHCLFYKDQKTKNIYYKFADEILSLFDFENEDEDDAISLNELITSSVDDTSTSDKLIDYIEQHVDFSNETLNNSMGKSIVNTSQRLPKKEEYAADIFAIEMLYETFSKLNLINDHNIQSVFETAFDTFFFLSNYNNIEDKIDLGHNKRDVTLRPSVSFDSIRWMVVYAALCNISKGKFNIDDPLKEKIIPYSKKGYEYILKLADKKYDKYLEITSRGSGIRRNESLYKEASTKISSLIDIITSNLQ